MKIGTFADWGRYARWNRDLEVKPDLNRVTKRAV